MKKYIAIAFLLAVVLQTQAQDVNKDIKQDDVERIIKTLSADDMQGRGNFTPGLEKAAQFYFRLRTLNQNNPDVFPFSASRLLPSLSYTTY